MDEPDAPAEPVERTAVHRSVGLGLAVGLAVGLATVGVVYSIIAIPFYALAQSDSSGLDRPFFRHGLINWGIPIGLAIGLACGVLVGSWYARGGRLPTDRSAEDYR